MNHDLEPAAKVLAATAVSQSLSFCLERKYLHNITNATDSLFELDPITPTSINEAAWISITQVGVAIDKSTEICFTALQKILFACFIPKEMQLIFLVIGEGETTQMMIGLRSPLKASPSKNLIKNLNEFIKGVWPGLQTVILQEDCEILTSFKRKIADDTFDNVVALTGIPSIESQYKTLYPATIDKLISGMKRSKNYAYMVVADPIDSNDVDQMLFQCREMNGQAESLKSMNVTEGISEGETRSITNSNSNSISNSVSESISKKDFSKLGKAAMAATGMGVAASFFPAASAVLDGCVNAAGALTSAAVGMMGGSMLGGLVSGLMPQKTTSTSTTNTTSQSTSITTGVNESKSQSISRNVVSKHIEAVSEHLFYHSKRLEAGKAIGLWKVGVYMLSEKKSDIESGSLQLRSILSGQESIYEPVRIHDISAILDENTDTGNTLRERTIGRFSAPTLAINTMKGKRFEHPLGEHYKELRTVLTTKELSYLINFPLRSVPGINVVESAPDFSLNRQQYSSNARLVQLGKIISGGSSTDMEFGIDLNKLNSHVFVAGVKNSGKTNTVLSMLEKIGDFPFLVIEQEKREYVDWANTFNKIHPDRPIRIYMPGCKDYADSLTINPFELYGKHVDEESEFVSHIDRLKIVLSSLFQNNDMLSMLTEDIVYSACCNSGWNKESSSSVKLYPKFSTLLDCIKDVLESYGFVDYQKNLLYVSFSTRIKSLIRGWKGDLLNADRSTPSELLYGSPCIVNLSCLSDETERTFVTSLLLLNMFEYRLCQHNMGIEHVCVIEEASNVLPSIKGNNRMLNSMSRLFRDMLSIIGPKGEGLILVDTSPDNMTKEVIQNVGTKICHRLLSVDDCAEMGSFLGLKKEQQPLMRKLALGQCIVANTNSAEKYWIEVSKSQFM